MGNKIEKFEDLIVWQKSMDFVENIYKAFKECRDFGFKDQIQRAAVSIPANISEGFERSSNKEFIRFLVIAKGSAGECRTLLIIAKRLSIISSEGIDKYLFDIKEISSMLSGLIKARMDKF